MKLYSIIALSIILFACSDDHTDSIDWYGIDYDAESFIGTSLLGEQPHRGLVT